MRNIFLEILVFCILISCKTDIYISNDHSKTIFQSVQIDTLLEDEISIRAILVDENKVWYSANEGRFGFYNLDNNQKFEGKITTVSYTHLTLPTIYSV